MPWAPAEVEHARALGKSTDPAVKIARRDARSWRRLTRRRAIMEAADAVAANAAHSAYMNKELTGCGYTGNQEAAPPCCLKHDWPDRFSNLGNCTKSHRQLEGHLAGIRGHYAGTKTTECLRCRRAFSGARRHR